MKADENDILSSKKENEIVCGGRKKCINVNVCEKPVMANDI